MTTLLNNLSTANVDNFQWGHWYAVLPANLELFLNQITDDDKAKSVCDILMTAQQATKVMSILMDELPYERLAEDSSSDNWESQFWAFRFVELS